MLAKYFNAKEFLILLLKNTIKFDFLSKILDYHEQKSPISHIKTWTLPITGDFIAQQEKRKN